MHIYTLWFNTTKKQRYVYVDIEICVDNGRQIKIVFNGSKY